MAIDLYSQQEETPRWKKILLISGIIILATVLVVFIYNQVIKIAKNNVAIEEINLELNKQGTEEQIKDRDMVLEAEKKIDEFKKISDVKPVFNVYFDAFKTWVYPRVSFLSSTINAETAEVTLKGKTDTLQSVMQEMTLLDAETDVLSYTISNIVVGPSVTFDLVLKVNPELFKQQKNNEQ